MTKRQSALPVSLALVLVTALVTLLVAACGGSGTGATASPSTPGEGTATTVTVTGAWVRTGQAGAMTAAYFTLQNTGTAEDALVSVTASVGMATMHETTTDASGMTGMQPVEKVVIPAGGSVSFEPGGYHVMIMGLSADLKVGDKVDLKLVYKNAAPVDVTAEVRAS